MTLLILVGMSSVGSESDNVPYEDPSTIEEKNLTFDMQQRVRGTGFFATYRHSSMPDADWRGGAALQRRRGEK